MRGMRIRFSLVSYTLCSVLVLLYPAVSEAQGLFDSVSGFFDFTFYTSSIKSTDSSGNTVKTTQTGYHPRFSLAINTQIFPNLNLSAGGTVETTIFKGTTNDVEAKSTGTIFRPYINLTWVSAPYTVQAGYSRREDIQKIGSGPSVTNVNEDYNVIFGWKPEDFPSVDLMYTKTNYYDKDREIEDTTTDSILLGVKYRYKNLDVKYQATYDDQKNNLIGLETKGLVQSGRISYSDSLFNRRVTFNTSYNISRQDSRVISEGKGEVSFQTFPIAGLFIINIAASPVALDPNPALIDGNTAASAGMNIGVPPLGGDTTSLRQVGIDFLVSTEVNQLFLWVDRDLSTATNIRNFFTSNPDGIRVYQSSDNLNWTLVPVPPLSISFGPSQNRFEIGFLTPVTARYFKVVTRPLPAAIAATEPSFLNPDLIFITELQAFLTKPVEDLKSKSYTMSHLFNVDGKVRILNIPMLFYDFNFFFSRFDPDGVSQYNLSNALSVAHRFSQVFSGTARVEMDLESQPGRRTTQYLYNASLEATPLRTLTHTLLYSGRFTTSEEGSRYYNSITLNNSAKLYKGIDLYLTGGLNFGRNETGEKLFGTNVSIGSNIVPHPTLTFNLSFSNTTSDLSGGGKPSTSSYTRGGDFNFTFSPIRTLYLFGGITVATQQGQKTSILQTYSLGWSPISGGDLQLNIGYTENLRSSDNGRERRIGPTLTWKVTPRSTLDVSYQYVTDDSKSQKTSTNSFVTRLQVTF